MASGNEIVKTAKGKMEKSEDVLRGELSKIRAGQANAGLVSGIQVMYYDVLTPLQQVAAISIPEPRVLLIKPYDVNALEDIEKAIYQSDLGIAPANDGEVIRLAVPQLTGETRRELAKTVGKTAEQSKVSIRQIRRSAMDDLKKAEKSGEITEDELHSFEKDIQNETDNSIKKIDQIAATKEKEITAE